MKYIKQFICIVLIAFSGECMNMLIPLPIPASLYGMLILFLFLQLKIIKLSQIEETADFFLNIMPIFFISPTVSLMSCIGTIKDNLVGILIICVVSTIVVMIVTGVVSQSVIRNSKRGVKE